VINRKKKKTYNTPIEEVLDGVLIKEAVPVFPFLIVEENDIVTQVIDGLSSKKTNLAVMIKRGKPIGTIDVLDIASYCNKRIASSSHSLFEELAPQFEQLKRDLSKATVREILPDNAWQSYRIVNSTKSLLHLIHIMCRQPSLKFIPIVENGKAITACSHKDVFHFLLNEKKLSNKLKLPISSIKFQKNISCVTPTKEEMLDYAFMIMWEKQINGKVACCNNSSPLDLFFNWLHYVHSAINLFNQEPGQVQSHATVEEAMELFLNENLHYLHVIDNRRQVLGVLTVPDLLAFIAQ